MSQITTVGVIGAGQMGNGIAHVAALAGYNVVLSDISQESLDKALKTIEKNLGRQVSKALITDQESKDAFAKITISTDLAAMKDADIIIEAASENIEIKKAIFKNLLQHIKPEAILASNTSSISITRLGASTDRPEKFIGLHFMNPVPVMKLVEIIRGLATDETTYAAALEVVTRMGKITTNAEDFPAFIVNRILVPMINEAIYTLYEGVGTVESIDKGMRMGANHPMGPLELGDFIGLDTVLAIMQVLNEGLADTKYRPCPLLVKYVEAGWLGRKTNRGFYDYRGETPVPTR
ncbi:3-hydroxybutyryl-CoA dehydrogenase [Pseudaquidulcibacter saccharophilus]|uniref:3-hydroxybutyryl-CoA dehydrogenase n=1 Tax=Pseudaquidulcibacter saccharophilus TaxID=2831900 RepID=UPI001EFF57AF|nr:3-hydroxybutyryl-CoA dehydrogenase [Pseudaquidulcibacter saccharophilus]